MGGDRALWPAGSRPYIGGSQHNSILELTFGYNGFGRLTGNETGSVVGGTVVGAGGGGMWGPTGIGRLFGTEIGTQISWLLPAALLLGVALVWDRRSAPRTDGRRAAVLIWGSWLVVTGLVLSFAKGIIHPYYTVVLAPAIGALVGIGVAWAWGRRERVLPRLLLAAALATTAVWAFVLLERTSAWLPWLRLLVLVGGIAGTIMVTGGPRLWCGHPNLGRAVLCLVLASPARRACRLRGGDRLDPAHRRNPVGWPRRRRWAQRARRCTRPRRRHAGRSVLRARWGRKRAGRLPGRRPGGRGLPLATGDGRRHPRRTPRGRGRRPRRTARLVDAEQALVGLPQRGAGGYTWVAAAVGSTSAAGVQLATGEPVMAIGGFNGTDPTPTLPEFQADVAAGKIHYLLAGGNGGMGGVVGRSGSSSAIAAWVEQTFTATTVGGVAVYDLTASAAGT